MAKVTDKQIQEWKEKYGGAFAIDVEDKVAYFRIPTMQDWKRALGMLSTRQDSSYEGFLIESLFIGGDEEVKTNDVYYIPAKSKIATLLADYEDATWEKTTNGFDIKVKGKTATIKPIDRKMIATAEARNPQGKPFVTSDKLWNEAKVSCDPEFDNANDPEFRIPLYKAIEEIKKQKEAIIKKL